MNKWEKYEIEKKKITSRSPLEYEKKIRRLVNKLKI